MHDWSALIALWPVVLSVVGLIVWFARLEWRISIVSRDLSAIEKRVEVLAAKHDALDSKVVEQLSEVRESLARIEGALGVNRGK